MNAEQRFLVRTPSYRAGESPTNYLIRIAEENGYDSFGSIVDFVAKDEQYVITTGWDYRKLRAILPEHCAPWERLGYAYGKPNGRGSVSLVGLPLHKFDLGLERLGVCPECIEELGYAPAWWDLIYAVACPRHKRLLVRTCPECGSSLRFRRPGLLRCQCGAHLARAPRVLPPDPVLGLMEILVSRVHGDRLVDASTRCGFPTDALRACSLRLACKLVRVITSVLHDLSGATHQNLSIRTVEQSLLEVSLVLSNWPTNFRALCARWAEHCSVRRPRLASFSGCFSWAFVRLFKNLGVEKRQMRFLVREVLAFGHENWDRSEIVVNHRELRGLSLPPKRFAGCGEAARLLGLREYTLRRWIDHGRVPGRWVHRTNRRRFLVDMEAARRMRRSAKPQLGCRSAARLIGLPIHLLKEARRAGLIKSEYLVPQRAAFAEEDLTNVRDALLSSAISTAGGAETVSLAELTTKKHSLDLRLELLSKILDGREVHYVPRPNSDRVDALRVRVTAVDDLLRERPAPQSITAFAAMRRFGLTYFEARSLALRNVVQVNRRFKERYILTVECLVAFMNEYAPVTAEARKLGVSVRQLLLCGKQAGVPILRIETKARRARGISRHSHFIPRTHLHDLVRSVRARCG